MVAARGGQSPPPAAPHAELGLALGWGICSWKARDPYEVLVVPPMDRSALLTRPVN